VGLVDGDAGEAVLVMVLGKQREEPVGQQPFRGDEQQAQLVACDGAADFSGFLL
jgi:hypothetical protein